jgi:hypothetical protein
LAEQARSFVAVDGDLNYRRAEAARVEGRQQTVTKEGDGGVGQLVEVEAINGKQAQVMCGLGEKRRDAAHERDQRL